MRVYLAGPMRGIPDFNFPAFDYAEAKLSANGFTVFSPAARDRSAYGAEIEDNPTGDETKVANPNCTINDCMAADTEWICREAEAIALLPGWEQSKGAKAEHALAQALGLTVIVLGKAYVAPAREEIKAPVEPIAEPAAPLFRSKEFLKYLRQSTDEALSPWTFLVGNMAEYEPERLSAEQEVDRLNAEWKQEVHVSDYPPRTRDPMTFAPQARRLLSTLSSGERKEYPITTGVFDYFPDALALVANVSFNGNKKHNPGQPLHWARGKSMDHEDCIARHTIERDVVEDNVLHAANRAWRALAALQELAEERWDLDPPRGVRDLD